MPAALPLLDGIRGVVTPGGMGWFDWLFARLAKEDVLAFRRMASVMARVAAWPASAVLSICCTSNADRLPGCEPGGTERGCDAPEGGLQIFCTSAMAKGDPARGFLWKP